MTNNKYFPHDATASNNIKLMSLMTIEGARGYGIYWYLVEFLSQQQDYKGHMNIITILAQRLRTKPAVLIRIITDYGLFTIEGDTFSSPGLLRRMQPLLKKRNQFLKKSPKEETPKEETPKEEEVKDDAQPCPKAEEQPKEKKAENAAERAEILPSSYTHSATTLPTVCEHSASTLPTVCHDSATDLRPQLLSRKIDNSLKYSQLTLEKSTTKRKSKEDKRKEERKNISPLYPPSGEVSREDERRGNGSIPPEREVFRIPKEAYNPETHNLDGLLSTLSLRKVCDPKEVQAILRLSDFGRMGHEVWKILYHTNWDKIKKPGLFIIAELRKKRW